MKTPYCIDDILLELQEVIKLPKKDQRLWAENNSDWLLFSLQIMCEAYAGFSAEYGGYRAP